MKTQLLVVALILAGTLLTVSSPLQAQIPITRGGAPVFRAAYFRPDGPQPFSTRSMRESQAARSQGSVNRSSLFGGFSSRYQQSGTTYQSSRRVGIFSRRGKRFR